MDNQRIAKLILRVAKKRPETLFEQSFFDIREKASEMLNEKAKKIAVKMSAMLKKDLSSKGFKSTVTVKIGKFRGYQYITSAIIMLKAKKPFVDESDSRIEKLTKYLVSKYSPKYKFKSVIDGEAKFNVR